MDPAEEKTTGNGEAPPKEIPGDLPKLENKIASQDKKIAYLISKFSKMDSKKDNEIEAPRKVDLLEGRLADLKRVLFDNGLELLGFSDCGIVRLKPTNEAGFDALRKLNTLFPIDILECYFEQYLK